MASKTKLKFRSLINRSAEEIFKWHYHSKMVERCLPPFEKTIVLCTKGRPIDSGSRIQVRTELIPPFWSKQTITFGKVVPNESFTLSQKGNAFQSYEYKMEVTPQSEHTSEVVDTFELTFNVPQFLLSSLSKFFSKKVERIINYKHETLDHDIGLIRKYPFKTPLKILVSGSHGLIGKNLSLFLEFMGHEVWSLCRRSAEEDKVVLWDPKTGECNPKDFEGFDAVIHLAGENVGKGRWNRKKKEEVLKSRYQGTENLTAILKNLNAPPKTFICASAVGYYGDRGGELITEESGPGKDLFLSEVCEKWERASNDLKETATRVVHTRFGTVLSPQGGALKKMLPLFKWGLGGKVGSGRQYMSWVSIDDVLGSIYHIMMTPEIHGPVNVVSPHPLPNDSFAKKLTKHLKSWIGCPLPEFVVRLLLGQKGEEFLLTSCRVIPKVLTDTGYTFQYPKLCQTFEHIL